MLNPPLSHLSDDLLASIVEEVAKLQFLDEDLKNLSLADRAFTQSCQKYIHRMLRLGNRTSTPEQLTRVKTSLDEKPSFANRVRVVVFGIPWEEETVLFKDPNFTSILQLLAKSPIPPNELRFTGLASFQSTIEDPMLVTRQLAESFFSQTLTVLHLREIANIPLPLFLICPRLREVILDIVGVTDKSYDKYPDNQCSGREAPLLEVFEHRNSHSLVEQMITPPPRFKTPVILWSNLRVLTVAPDDAEGMTHLQHILDAACNTLKELYLTNMYVGDCRCDVFDKMKQNLTNFLKPAKQLPFDGLVNLSKLPNLHTFSLAASVNCKKPRKAPRNAPPFDVLRDISIVLSTIPESNKITNLWFDFSMVGRRGRRPFLGCLNQDWVGMFNEVIRIGGGKPLELELQMTASMGFLEDDHPEQDEVYTFVMEKAASLSDYPNICTHFWDPTYWKRKIGPFPRGQVRRRCRR